MSDPFLTQRLGNAFPKHTKTRRDPSSNAQRFYGVFSEVLAEEYAVLAKSSQDFSLLRDWLPWSSLLVAQLEAADFMTHDLAADGSQVWAYPTTVTVDLGFGPTLLERVDEADDLFSQLPGQLQILESTPVSTWLLYDSDVGTISSVDFPSKLIVRVSDSTEYYLRGQGEFTSGRYFVDIAGYDQMGNEIEERVIIRDDGSYMTREYYSEIISVSSHGFNGRIRIYLGSDQQGLINPYYLGVTDRGESPLRHTLDVVSGEAALYSWADQEIYGANYRRGGEVLDVEDTELWAKNIRSSSDAVITPVDMAFDYHTGMIVVLDDAGYLHWYDSQRSSFSELSRMGELGHTNYLEIHALTNWCLLGEEVQLFTRFQRPYIRVHRVKISRVIPAGTVYYLQADKTTWNVTEYWHVYNTDAQETNPTATWQDFGFTATLSDEGEHEFYLDCEDHAGTVTSTGTKVLVDVEAASVSLNSYVVSGVGETPERLFLDDRGEFCVGTAEGNVWQLRRYFFHYYADTEHQSLWLNLFADAPAPSPALPITVEVTY